MVSAPIRLDQRSEERKEDLPIFHRRIVRFHRLPSRGHQVEILHKWLMIAEQVERYTKGIVFQRLYAHGVTITPSTRVRAVDGDRVTTYNVHTGTERTLAGIDSVVLCLGAVPNDGLFAALRPVVPEIHLVGSAFAPRGLADATLHGASVGRLL